MDPHPHPQAQDNGTQKWTHPHIHAAEPLYRECLKNHAATLGAHATDGCGEFIASPASTPSDPSSLTCAACGCHRNFHRRVDAADEAHTEGDDEEDEAGSHVLLTLKTGGGGPATTTTTTSPAAGPAGALKRKRFRSRFSREQKEGMMELAEKLGWRLQRRGEDVVDEGCRRIGVERGVFKVWMHNNKQAVLEMKKRDQHYGSNNNNNNINVNNNSTREENNKVNGVKNCSSSSPSDPN